MLAREVGMQVLGCVFEVEVETSHGCLLLVTMEQQLLAKADIQENVSLWTLNDPGGWAEMNGERRLERQREICAQSGAEAVIVPVHFGDSYCRLRTSSEDFVAEKSLFDRHICFFGETQVA